MIVHKKSHPRTGERWSEEETQQFLQWLSEGKTLPWISAQTNRTITALQARLKRIGRWKREGQK